MQTLPKLSKLVSGNFRHCSANFRHFSGNFRHCFPRHFASKFWKGSKSIFFSNISAKKCHGLPTKSIQWPTQLWQADGSANLAELHSWTLLEAAQAYFFVNTAWFLPGSLQAMTHHSSSKATRRTVHGEGHPPARAFAAQAGRPRVQIR